MKIIDNLYGEHKITEPVLLELLETDAMQRLKGVAQYGWEHKNYPYPGFSRYEHSVGVMILLARHKTSLKEKVAGLLHDVSHTVFSHITDYAFGHEKDEDLHDNIRKKYFLKTDAKKILTKYGYDYKEISDIKNFRLLKRDIPHLCADNIDYALREFKLWANPKAVDEILADIVVIDENYIFKKINLAQEFANTFLRLQTEHWGSFNATSRFCRMAKILQITLQDKILTLDDLFTEDQAVIDKIYQSQRQDLIKILEDAQGEEITNRIDRAINKKFRYVDPPVLIDGISRDLSQIDLAFASNLERHQIINKQGLSL